MYKRALGMVTVIAACFWVSAASAAGADSDAGTSLGQYGIETIAAKPFGGGLIGPLPSAMDELPVAGPREFYVYGDAKEKSNHFFPTGWMGDWNDIKMNQNSRVLPHSGSSCIEFVYTAKGSRGARWAGVYWQNPGNNWGGIEGRIDLRGATRLTFWARGKSGGETIETVKVGGIKDTFGDSDEVSMGPIVLTREWKQYRIDLRKADLSAISGGFCWMTSADHNPGGATFYLDDIRYEYPPAY